MGRAMLLAAEYPFQQAVGIELNPLLAKVAQRNLEIWQAAGRARTQMQVICGDAVDAPFAKGPCVLFLFNPFGASVMRRLLKRLAVEFADRTGQLDLLYVNNEQEGVIERSTGLYAALSWEGAPFAGRRHRGSQDHGQPARWRIRLGQLRGLLGMALDWRKLRRGMC